MTRFRVNCIQSKTLAQASKCVIATRMVNLSNTRDIRLVGYSVTGQAGVVPPFVRLNMGCVSSERSLDRVTQGTEDVLDELTAGVVLFLPGGVASEGSVGEQLIAESVHNIDLNKVMFKLETYNPATQTFVPYTDYTMLVLKLAIDTAIASGKVQH